MRQKLLVFVGIATVLLASSIRPAEAQHHPFFLGVSQWYPYPVFGFPPVPGIFPIDHASSIRFQVSPREAQVFVDGYAAGIVDDYDGVFQRLQLIPGHHEIVVYLYGYRSLRQNLYLSPRSTHTIKQTLVPLPPGEAAEPQPVPRQMPPIPAMPPPAAMGPAARTGALALRVQPGDASVYVDGELWHGSQGQDRLVVQLVEGSHRLRVEKPGFQPFAVDVDVRAGETTSLNVSLSE